MKISKREMDHLYSELRLRLCQAILIMEPEKLVAFFEFLLKEDSSQPENKNE